MKSLDFMFSLYLGILMSKGVLSEQELKRMSAYFEDNKNGKFEEDLLVELLSLLD